MSYSCHIFSGKLFSETILYFITMYDESSRVILKISILGTNCAKVYGTVVIVRKENALVFTVEFMS